LRASVIFRVAHASRVSGFGVAPKRTFLWPHSTRKVRDGETPSPARETRALPHRNYACAFRFTRQRKCDPGLL